MNCVCASIKYLLFIFNFIFALCGAALIVVGAILQWNLDYYDEIFGEEFVAPSIILIVAGCIIFCISFFGCFGAIRESNCFLYLYCCFLMLSVAVLVTGTSFAFINADVAEDDILNSMKTLFGQYSSNEDAKEVVDDVQEWFHCCGVEGPSYWPGEIPDSCDCDTEDFTEGECNLDGHFRKGCGDTVYEFYSTMQYVLGGLSIGFAVIAILGVLLTCMLTGAIKKGKSRRGSH